MSKRYVLGVDGGNTKTQYFLFDLSGKYVDGHIDGTCSHEKMPGGFAGCKIEMERQLGVILSKNNIEPKDLAFSVFGLAGADFAWQKHELEKILHSLGFTNFIVDNDGYIALKAGSLNGSGICNINGTGTVTVGIDPQGKRLQFGGIGPIGGDEGGGAYLAQRAAAAVYSELFRCGRKTVLTEMIIDEFGIIDKYSYSEEILRIIASDKNILKVNLMLNEAEKLGDAVAMKILSDVGISLGETVAGCINHLSFVDSVNIVLAGSVWVRGGYNSMLEAFKRTVAANCTAMDFSYLILRQAPAIGAVIWALEEIGGVNALIRAELLSAV